VPTIESETDYLSLGGQTLVELVKVGGTTTPSYLHPDLLGSPHRKTDANGDAQWREHYDPYGMKLNGVAEKVGYTGHAYDSETGLTYMQARFYDPLVGRFLSTDPVGFDASNPYGFNRYSYANNNPYRFTDPFGMQAELPNDPARDEEERKKREKRNGEYCGGVDFTCHRFGGNRTSGERRWSREKMRNAGSSTTPVLDAGVYPIVIDSVSIDAVYVGVEVGDIWLIDAVNKRVLHFSYSGGGPGFAAGLLLSRQVGVIAFSSISDVAGASFSVNVAGVPGVGGSGSFGSSIASVSPFFTGGLAVGLGAGITFQPAYTWFKKSYSFSESPSHLPLEYWP